jgi:hypothetical protein
MSRPLPPGMSVEEYDALLKEPWFDPDVFAQAYDDGPRIRMEQYVSPASRWWWRFKRWLWNTGGRP